MRQTPQVDERICRRFIVQAKHWQNRFAENFLRLVQIRVTAVSNSDEKSWY